MEVTMRKINVKGHTLGYKIGGKWRTRKDAVELARKGKIDGVRVCRGEYGHYIQSKPGCWRLYDLPFQIA